MSPRSTTFLTTSALVFALALALAGTSPAMPADVGGGDTTSTAIPNDRIGPLGVGGVESQTQAAPDWFERAALRGQGSGAGPVRPDDRGGEIGVGGIEQAPVRPDDEGGARGVGTLSEAQQVFSPTTADDGLDWQTVGFGAGAFMLALCAAALGALLLGGHRRTPAH